MTKAKVAILRTTPSTVEQDYVRLCELGGLTGALESKSQTILKDNITWHNVFPGVNTTPWQLQGTIMGLQSAGFNDLVAKKRITQSRERAHGGAQKGLYIRWAFPVLDKMKHRAHHNTSEKWVCIERLAQKRQKLL